VGIGGALYVGTDSYIAGSIIVTSSTVNLYATKTVITAGTDTAINTSTGNVTIWNTSTLQSITNRGNSTTNSIYAAQLYDNNNRVLTSVSVNVSGPGLTGGGTINGPSGSVTLVNTGVTSLTTGSGLAVTTSTGSVVISSIDTLQSVTNRGQTTNNAVTITNATQSLSTNSGALVVTGGLGIGGNLYVGGIINGSIGSAASATTVAITNNLNSATTQYITFVSTSSGYAGIQTAAISGLTYVPANNTFGIGTSSPAFTLDVAGGARVTGIFTITNTTPANSTQSGALIVSGGIGANQIYGSTIFDSNNRVITSVTVNTSGSGLVGGGTITGPSGTITLVNTGVTSLNGSAYIGISSNTGSVTVTNLGVQTLTGSIALGVSQSTGTVVLTNLGTTATFGSTYIGVSQNTGSVTITNLGVQTLAGSTAIGVSSSTGTVTLTNLGVTSITTGSDIIVSAATGTVQISDISTLQSVTNRGATTNNAVNITNGTASINSQSGALQVTGGVGIQGTLNVGGNARIYGDLYIDGTQTYINSTNIQTGDKVIYVSTGAASASLANASGIAVGPTAGTYASLLFDGVNNWTSAAGINPSVSATYNLGSGSLLWNNVYSVNHTVTNILTIGTGGQYATIGYTTTATYLQYNAVAGTNYHYFTGASVLTTGNLIGQNHVVRGNISNDSNAYLTIAGGTSGITYISGNVGIGTSSTTYTLQVVGSFAATTKSFVIDHPTKPGMELRYGSLEGPENGVYVRGRIKTKTIMLPDYWTELVDGDSITVQLTPVGKTQNLYVKEIKNNTVTIGGARKIDCFYTVYGTRKDVEKLKVETPK
jgi:hypothetical protein